LGGGAGVQKLDRTRPDGDRSTNQISTVKKKTCTAREKRGKKTEEQKLESVEKRLRKVEGWGESDAVAAGYGLRVSNGG